MEKKKSKLGSENPTIYFNEILALLYISNHVLYYY